MYMCDFYFMRYLNALLEYLYLHVLFLLCVCAILLDMSNLTVLKISNYLLLIFLRQRCVCVQYAGLTPVSCFFSNLKLWSEIPTIFWLMSEYILDFLHYYYVQPHNRICQGKQNILEQYLKQYWE